MVDNNTNIAQPNPAESAPGKSRKMMRVLAVIALVLVLAGVAQLLDAETFTIAGLQDQVRDAGPLGILMFFILFSVGLLLYIPGFVFVAVAILLYGQVQGALVSMGGSLVAISVSFFVIRGIVGTPLAELKADWARKIMQQLEDHPIRSVMVLRIALFVIPPVNYSLALSGISYRNYIVGSAIGLLVPVTGLTFAFDWMLVWLQAKGL